MADGTYLAHTNSMRASVVLGSLFVLGCQGQVGALGEMGDRDAPVATIRDRSGPEVVAFTCTASTVATRQTFSCTAQATHPTNEALRCSLELGDGRDALSLGDCSTAVTTQLRYSSPGNLRVTLNVLDQQDRLSSRTLPVQVTGLPNQPPEIVGLTASQTSGVAPLDTTLSWSSTDPEGDPVSCALDIGADGTIEQPQVSCATWPLELRTVGTIAVKVIATDSGGLTSDRIVTLTVAPPTKDVRIEAVEFGQTVMKANLKLVQDKPALLRVTVLANEPGLSTVVEVEAKQGATVLGTQRLTGPAILPQVATPADLSRSFRFPMPRTWLVPGLSLTVKVDPTDALMEADESNNTQVVTPTMARDNVLHLTGVPVVIGTQTANSIDLDDAVTSVWPVKSVDQKTRAPYTFTGTLSGGDVSGWSQLLGQIAQVAGADGSSRAYYGFVPGGSGGIAGLGYLGQHVAIGLDSYGHVAPHELGHNFGINHAPCGGAAGADSNYPYPNAQIGSWGFNGAQLLAPTQYVDLMSYCQSAWVSDYNYAKAQQHMENSGTFDPDAVLPAIVAADTVLVSGRITEKGAVLSPVYRLHGSPTATEVDSDTRLLITTVEGRQFEVPVTLMQPAEGEELHFFAVIPWPGELARLSVARGGMVLASREAMPMAASEVSVRRVSANSIQVAWSGGATATVAHLGAERTTLTIGAAGGSVLLRTDGLDGGEYEVSLSNGLSTSRKTFPLPAGEGQGEGLGAE